MTTYRVYQINTGFFLDPEFTSVSAAKDYARTIKSDFLVYHGSTVIGSVTGPEKVWSCFHSEYHFVK